MHRKYTNLLAGAIAGILILTLAIPKAAAHNETGLVISEAFVLRQNGGGANNELLGISTRGFLHDASFTDISVSSIIIGGSDPMTVVFRGRSTSISETIQTDKISDTVIEVVRVGTGVIGTNDNWADAENLELLEGTSLDPASIPMGENESLLVMTDLPPGAYSVRVKAKEAGERGLVISEAFAMREPGTLPDNELLGISTRGYLDDQQFTDISVSSVIIGGTDPMTVVFRGRSTSISATIETEKVTDTLIEVVRVGTGVIGSNDNWADAENLELLEGTSLDPASIPMGETESLLVMTDLPPGAYSVRVTAKPDPGPGPAEPPEPQTFSFTQSGTDFTWNISGDNGDSQQAVGNENSFQTITARVGDTLVFSGSVGGDHPWHLRNASFQDLTAGLSGSPNGSVGTFTQTWNTSGYASGTYHYQCGAHPNMIGNIVLTQ